MKPKAQRRPEIVALHRLLSKPAPPDIKLGDEVVITVLLIWLGLSVGPYWVLFPIVITWHVLNKIIDARFRASQRRVKNSLDKLHKILTDMEQGGKR